MITKLKLVLTLDLSSFSSLSVDCVSFLQQMAFTYQISIPQVRSSHDLFKENHWLLNILHVGQLSDLYVMVLQQRHCITEAF